MKKGGLIIRLIDIALILLLGFIAISDIRIRSQVKLPSPGKEGEAIRERKLIFLNINPRNQYSIKYDDYSDLDISGLNVLETRLLELKDKFDRKNFEMVVLIEPHQESIVQRTVDILDLCEKHHILKNINYQSLEL